MEEKIKKIDEEQEFKLEYNTTVGFKSFGDSEKENELLKPEFLAANNILKVTPYKPTIAEEMNLTWDPSFIYVGKGSLY